MVREKKGGTQRIMRAEANLVIVVLRHMAIDVNAT